MLRQESKYEIEKRISEQKAEMEREKLIELEKNKWKNYLIIGVVFVALLLLYLVFNTIKKLKIIAQKKKQNKSTLRRGTACTDVEKVMIFFEDSS